MAGTNSHSSQGPENATDPHVESNRSVSRKRIALMSLQHSQSGNAAKPSRALRCEKGKLEQLPFDMWDRILSFLEPSTGICAVAATCYALRTLVTSCSSWECITFPRFGVSLHAPLDTLLFRNWMVANKSIARAGRAGYFQHVRSLSFTGIAPAAEVLITWISFLPSLQHLYLPRMKPTHLFANQYPQILSALAITSKSMRTLWVPHLELPPDDVSLIQLAGTTSNLSTMNLGAAVSIPADVLTGMILNSRRLVFLALDGVASPARRVVSDVHLVCLSAACPSLKYLSLTYRAGAVTDDGLQRLSRGCPGLTHLALQCEMPMGAVSGVTDAGLLGLVTWCTALSELIVDGNARITDEGTVYLARLQQLMHLSLVNCYELTDAAVHRLSAMSSLRSLNMLRWRDASAEAVRLCALRRPDMHFHCSRELLIPVEEDSELHDDMRGLVNVSFSAPVLTNLTVHSPSERWIGLTAPPEVAKALSLSCDHSMPVPHEPVDGVGCVPRWNAAAATPTLDTSSVQSAASSRDVDHF